MASSLARFRHTMKVTPEKVKCPHNEKPQVKPEEFPTFTKDLYFSVFPPTTADRRIDDDVETDHNLYMKQMSTLSSGRLGKTYASMRKDFTPYACTIVPKPDVKFMVAVTKIDAKKVDYVDALRASEPFILHEKEASPFICKILMRFRSRLPYQLENYYFVSEYWPDGTSICKYVQTVGKLTEDTARFYLMELADALMYIHQHGKIMRRLSICSMLIEPYGHLRLAPYTLCEQNLDCGQACNMLVKNCGDQFYAAPEVVFGVDVQYVADWWSFGVIMYQMLTGELPFTGRTLGDLGKAITECTPEIPDYLSGEATALLKHLLHKDPRRRLGFSQDLATGSESGSLAVKNHPFFQTVLWRHVRNTMIAPPIQPLEMSANFIPIRKDNKARLCTTK